MLLTALAVAAAALGGGTYEGDVDAPCDSSCGAKLVVVDDGRSLTTDSIVPAPCDFAETTDRDSRPAPRGTAVKADGSFRWRTRFQVVEGKFAGRSVTGTARFVGRARDDCSAETFTFTAALKRRARPNGRCEPLDDVAVFVRRTGCTKATRVVDAWDGKRGCRALRACRAGGRACVPVSGGRLSAIASVACVAGPSRIELVVTKRCNGSDGPAGPTPQGPGPFFLEVGAINVSCDTAESVASTWSDSGCERRACTVLGWRCPRPKGSPSRTRCRRGHAAVDLRRRQVIVES
jgi:hypothetical protein